MQLFLEVVQVIEILKDFWYKEEYEQVIHQLEVLVLAPTINHSAPEMLVLFLSS